MSAVKVFSLVQEKEWAQVIESFPLSCQDIYFTHLYAGLEETVQSGNAQCFFYSEGDYKGLITYFLRPIQETGFFDVESFYGYGGPLINNKCDEFKARFEENWLDFCRQKGIVAEFCRFHPLINNHVLFQKNIKVLKNRATVLIDLTQKDLWNESLSSKNRNMIRKSEKSGVFIEQLETDRGIDRFKDIYWITMDCLQADPYFYFSNQYFEKLKTMGENIIVLGAVLNGELVAASLLLKWKYYFHYHLSGSLPQYRVYAPGNLLIWKAMNIARDAGCRVMHLGGGRTDLPDDTLFKFKKSFSSQTAQFYIGMRVHDRGVYNNLIGHWQEENPGKKQKLFLQYRYTAGQVIE